MHDFLSQSLKETMYRIVPEKQEEVAEFRKKYGDKSLGEYTVDQVYFTLHVTISRIASHFLFDFVTLVLLGIEIYVFIKLNYHQLIVIFVFFLRFMLVYR